MIRFLFTLKTIFTRKLFRFGYSYIYCFIILHSQCINSVMYMTLICIQVVYDSINNMFFVLQVQIFERLYLSFNKHLNNYSQECNKNLWIRYLIFAIPWQNQIQMKQNSHYQLPLILFHQVNYFVFNKIYLVLEIKLLIVS